MSLHLGHIVGLRLIKEALATTEANTETYVKEPLAEGSDQGERAINDMFDNLPQRNEMLPEQLDKVGAEAAFDTGTEVVEDRPDKDRKWRRGAPDIDANAQPTDKVWKEHDSFSPQSSDGMVIDQVVEPGPAL